MMKFIVIILFVLGFSTAHARSVGTFIKNNQGVLLYMQKKHIEAYDKFIALTADNPDDYFVQFNMAASLQAIGEYEKAIKMYAVLARDMDANEKEKLASGEYSLSEYRTLRFGISYNLGVCHQVLQNVDSALEQYQAALGYNVKNDEIKVNIEMLFAGGGGKGKGKNKDKSKGEGEGEGDPEDSEGQDPKDQDGEGNKKDQKEKKDQQQSKQPKEFDQKYMSNEDLKRIMEELGDQEQKIRAKMERKGVKSAPKDKEW